jgi:hypothetical protein
MFRFTIREALLVMVIVALAVGWYLEATDNTYESAYLKGAADEKAIWLHEYQRLRAQFAAEAEALKGQVEELDREELGEHR